ncbi:Type II restriction enzyme [Helicobacter pylori]|uniref:Type II restriction enzyme n=1 Tax=Helicobacter pylori TaxID=210 RepID=A0A377IQG1_HELPX|nr:restriction endonuclease [Helicobacter pylori]MCQ2905091.1 restriction endonuclease [Helicobacter pylori]MCQ2917488.1 restriction endonuclease [Helicobacter pylori]RVY58569.1 restriction endonuclease [Helicobacter pylori]RVY66814.1 restriction endonuclease [Helicobacter pylori]WRB08670.1 restriction endonuclease [Helicobacter pylori]
MFVYHLLQKFKKCLEHAILQEGEKGFSNIIRSQKPINYIHEMIKQDLVKNGIVKENIFPPLGSSKPEIKLAGFFKQKDQDICVIPNNMDKNKILINWGPLNFENKEDVYGFEFSQKCLVINIRSQMRSIAKNTDTLFERTFAESLNLHMRYPKIVLGEFYLIPVREYSLKCSKRKQIGFENKITNIEKYISFFSAISGRDSSHTDLWKYEKCCLMIVNLDSQKPFFYNNSYELKHDKIVSEYFALEYADIGFDLFVSDLLKIYKNRFSTKYGSR